MRLTPCVSSDATIYEISHGILAHLIVLQTEGNVYESCYLIFLRFHFLKKNVNFVLLLAEI